jgi:hypothetical protein
MSKKHNAVSEQSDKGCAYTAKIKDARKEFSLPDNSSYLDVWFDIYLDGAAVAERRLAFPMGTAQEAILAEVKKYCQMYENDHALAAECAKRSEAEAQSEKVLAGLKGQEV